MTRRMTTSLSELRKLVEQAMSPARYRFRQRLESLARTPSSARDWQRKTERLSVEINESVQRRLNRERSLPRPMFCEDTPITARGDEIAQAIIQHQVVVVCGETGCGKSTQLPQICLQANRGVDGLIGHTQPRRIAARSIASRIAEQLQSPVGRDVGFKIRFNDTTSPDGYIKLMTDGVLLAESSHDRFLNQYDTIIIDEAHERSLNIDFLLGYLKRLLPRRPELRLIITSATIDSERFRQHFSDAGISAPIVEVAGRSYPVEIRYRPIEDTTDSDEDWQLAIVRAIDELSAVDQGHILVFLPTERDIHQVSKLLRAGSTSRPQPARATEVLPLYSRLSVKEQNRIFRNNPGRRIVIATNVAESSLTVPGIRYVVDLGTARLSRYSARSQIQRLPIEPISQASAQQRAGRCGRMGPGICIRCYSEQDFQSRPPYTMPEIQRCSLAAVILQLQSLGLGDVEDFPFLDRPKPTAITAGYKTLFELTALDHKRKITPLGRQLSRLPVDPRIGRMIQAAHEEHCLNDVLIIAAALEVRDPRDRPHDRQQAADQAHEPFTHADSDFLGYLELWDFYQQQKRQLSRNRLRKMCQSRFLSHTRLREWANVHLQLLETAKSMNWKLGPRTGDPQAIHRALLTGLLSSVALRSETGDYTVASGGKARLWPGSLLAEQKPRWVMAAEFIETSGRYLRTVAAINPRWLEQLAAHLVNRNHSEPHWIPEAGATMAFERISLWGLPIVERRRVPYGPVDPMVSREIFIRSALVEHNWESQAPFLVHNRKLEQQLEQLQAKSRRLDLLKREEERFEFYDRRLPDDVFDATRLGKWRRHAERENERLLFMDKHDLLRADESPVSADDFPDVVQIGNSRFPLNYRLEPGEDDDGITLTVPAAALGQLNTNTLGWLVPGLLEQKIVCLIKSLPKRIRRQFVPVIETVRDILPRLRFGEGNLHESLAHELSRIAGEPVSSSAFQLDKLPQHLQMNVRVVDPQGVALGAGRDVQDLRRKITADPTGGLTDDSLSDWQRSNLTDWPDRELPPHVTMQRDGVELISYPALVDCQQSVSLTLVDNNTDAQHLTRRGVRRLFAIASKKKLAAQIKRAPQMSQMTLLAAGLPQMGRLEPQITDLVADRACRPDQELPRNQNQYRSWLAHGQNRISVATQDVTNLVITILEAFHSTRADLEHAQAPQWQSAVQDMHQQLYELVPDGFLIQTPWEWLRQFPRYLQAIQRRIRKLATGGINRDDTVRPELTRRRAEMLDATAAQHETHIDDRELMTYRWMLEEYRVSLFAQELGTCVKVSPQRLDRQWLKVRRSE